MLSNVVKLIGYDTKHLSEDDFNDSTDAGELEAAVLPPPCTKYNSKTRRRDIAAAELSTRTCAARRRTKCERGYNHHPPTSNDARFAACVGEFGLVLRKSQYAANASIAAVYERLESLATYIAADPYKSEFVTLVEKAIRSELY